MKGLSTSTTADKWHLFQNQVDRRWFGPPGKCSMGLDVDTNIRIPPCPASAPGARAKSTRAATRRFSISAASRSAQRRSFSKAPDAGGPIGRQGCKPTKACRANANVRILAQSGAWCGVDVDEDGNADGQVRTADLTSNLATMPPWITGINGASAVFR